MLEHPADSQVDPALWTAVIPAAGRGSRLGYRLPKILYPVAGRLMLDWLLEFLAPYCGQLIFVLSPDGAAPVIAALNDRIPERFHIVIQEHPTGMGEAVSLALSEVHTEHTAIAWGDQVALRPSSVEICLRTHQGPLAPDVTCPTVTRAAPYIHFVRDDAGRIESVLQAREGDSMPAIGESDTGFFCFRTIVLHRLFEQARQELTCTGRMTGEFNLLPIIAAAARQGTVLTPRHVSVEETIGINSAGDVAAVETFLRASHGNRG